MVKYGRKSIFSTNAVCGEHARFDTENQGVRLIDIDSKGQGDDLARSGQWNQKTIRTQNNQKLMEDKDTRGIRPLGLPLDTELQGLMDRIFPKEIPSPNLYRIVAKNKPLFQDLIVSKFIGPTGIFDKKRLDPRTRELLILRTCRANNNRYEYSLHKATISQKMGLLPEQITDIWNPSVNPGLWNDRDLSLFELVDRLSKKKEVSVSLYERLRAHFTESELMDIVLLIGFYTSVSMLVAFGRPELDNYNR